MKTSEHGGNIFAAGRDSGRRLHRLIDFSASINPLGPSTRAIAAIVSSFSLTAHYPDPDCTALREKLAARYGCLSEQVAIGNGSTELIHLLPRAFSIRRALIIGPTFSEYERAVRLSGGEVVRMNAKRTEDYRPPIAEALMYVRRNPTACDALILCHPNSPTGQAANREEALELVGTVSRRRGWAIVDETFVDYCEERSMLPALTRVPRLIVLRSFTKFYALPALRIGYLVGSAAAIRRIKPWQPPWSVSTLSQAAASASLDDTRYARESRAFMAFERPRLITRLKSLDGMIVYPSAANFLLVELPQPYTAGDIVGALRAQGVLIRDCSSVPGLNVRTVRVAVRTALQNDRLFAALRRLLRR